MYVAMADSGIKDFNLHIIIANRMAGKLIIVKVSVLGMKGNNRFLFVFIIASFLISVAKLGRLPFLADTPTKAIFTIFTFSGGIIRKIAATTQ